MLLFSASDFWPHPHQQRLGQRPWLGRAPFRRGRWHPGGDILGRFPTVALGTSTDVGSGRLLPTTSLTEYAASLGRWMA